MDVEHGPVLKAHCRGHIERFFGTANLETAHRLPGSTFSNISERDGDKPPETVAVVTIKEFWKVVLRFAVNIYNKRPHRALAGRSAEQLYVESISRHGFRLPPPPDQLARLPMKNVYRRPQRSGIEFEGLLYRDSQVAELKGRRNRPSAVRLIVDPADLTRSRFADADSGDSVEVPIRNDMRCLVEGRTLEHQRRSTSADASFLREMIGFAAERLMELEVGELTGGADGERASDRLVRCNGYQEWDWQTRAGTVELRIPKLRRGSYFPAFLDAAGPPRRR